MARRRKNKKLLSILAALILAVAGSLCFYFNPSLLDGVENTLGSSSTVQEGNFTVYYADVGQGDCSLVICDGETMLIDAGENGYEQAVLKLLDSQGVDTLDYAVATHPHSDHIGGMAEVLETFGANTFILPDVSRDYITAEKTYSNMINAAKNCNAKIENPIVGDSFNLGSAKVEIEGPISMDGTELNNYSLVIKITYGDTKFLFCGDAEADEENEILEFGSDVDADVLKVAHHGSSGSSTKEFLETVSPKYCVISCGENNDYGHPHKATLERLKKYTNEIYRTDICGTIKAESDGKNITFSY